jgi:hypothetical protein
LKVVVGIPGRLLLILLLLLLQERDGEIAREKVAAATTTTNVPRNDFQDINNAIAAYQSSIAYLL